MQQGRRSCSRVPRAGSFLPKSAFARTTDCVALTHSLYEWQVRLPVFDFDATNARFISKDLASSWNKRNCNGAISKPRRNKLGGAGNNKESGIFLRRKRTTSRSNTC